MGRAGRAPGFANAPGTNAGGIGATFTEPALGAGLASNAGFASEAGFASGAFATGAIGRIGGATIGARGGFGARAGGDQNAHTVPPSAHKSDSANAVQSPTRFAVVSLIGPRIVPRARGNQPSTRSFSLPSSSRAT